MHRFNKPLNSICFIDLSLKVRYFCKIRFHRLYARVGFIFVSFVQIIKNIYFLLWSLTWNSLLHRVSCTFSFFFFRVVEMEGRYLTRYQKIAWQQNGQIFSAHKEIFSAAKRFLWFWRIRLHSLKWKIFSKIIEIVWQQSCQKLRKIVLREIKCKSFEILFLKKVSTKLWCKQPKHVNVT